jgi:hypothetical protein
MCDRTVRCSERFGASRHVYARAGMTFRGLMSCAGSRGVGRTLSTRPEIDRAPTAESKISSASNSEAFHIR